METLKEKKSWGCKKIGLRKWAGKERKMGLGEWAGEGKGSGLVQM